MKIVGDDILWGECQFTFFDGVDGICAHAMNPRTRAILGMTSSFTRHQHIFTADVIYKIEVDCGGMP